MSWPRVSVVIPTFNRAGLLVQAVNSALAQTFQNLEVIVADDGSDDGTCDLLARYDQRVCVVQLDHSGLLGAVRNAALRRARGEYVAFLDSDDVWLPEKLERQVSLLDRDPAVGLVCSNARVIDENDNEMRQLYLRPEQGASGEVLAELVTVNFVIVSSAIARRRLVERAGGFGEDSRLRGIEDYDLWLRLAAVSKFAYVAEPLLAYREHRGSMRTGVTRPTYWTSLLVALDNLDRFLDANDPRRQMLLRRRRAELFVELARAQRSELGKKASMRSLREAVRVDAGTAAKSLLSRITRDASRAARSALRSAVRKGPTLP